MIGCPRCGEQLEDGARFCGMCGSGTFPQIALAPEADANLGRVIGGRYTLRERLGSGALGTVYRGEQSGNHRKVCVKLVDPDRAAPGAEQRFAREAAIMTELRSPHTLVMYDYGREDDGTLFIAMELSPGRTLAGVLAEEGVLDWWRVLRILYGLCDSLGEAHDKGIVHRDVHPKNIFLEERPSTRDFVKLGDFGLAKVLSRAPTLSPAGSTIGDLEYNSPEQLLQRPIDARSDLYALGVLGFRLVTGMHPMSGARTIGDLVGATIHQVPIAASQARPDLAITTDVDHLLARLLEKDPERRFPDTGSLAAMLRVALATRLPETTDTMREAELDIDEADVLEARTRMPD